MGMEEEGMWSSAWVHNSDINFADFYSSLCTSLEQGPAYVVVCTGTELIFDIVTGTVLCSGFMVKMLISH